MTAHSMPIVPGDLFSRHQIITGLRELADFLEATPDVQVCEYGATLQVFAREGDDASSAALVDQVAALLDVTVADDRASGAHYVATWTFGRAAYRIVHIPQRCREEHEAQTSYFDNLRLDNGRQAA
ncbi:hypothetical protein [Actinomadura rugatobispora]|uniref:Uncharacterized protein n=1 Tax=Actinomadura rugatobispora TaxID=1994 RepID=A0ABW1AH33_9ACTN|nr:hypothetical protein GCM10010200_046550 [Actinomadura rugatobispora]